jgi:nucleoside-diphosphate-sugar epimerase
VIAGPVVVLGASGFVGRHVCAALAAEGVPVMGVSRREVPGVHVVRADLTGPALPAVLGDLRPAAVVNVAGAVWRAGEAAMQELNVRLVERLLVFLESHPARLVHLGSVHEYGAVPTGQAITESAEPRPISPYGRTKLAATRMVLAQGRDSVVLRCVNAVGPGSPAGSLLGDLAARLIAAKCSGTPAVVRIERRNLRRDFVDVRDIADAVTAALRTPACPGLLNIGRGTAVPVDELVARLVEISGAPSVDAAAGLGATANGAGIDWQQVDTRAARRALGWAPRRSLDESLLDLWTSVRTAADTDR